MRKPKNDTGICVLVGNTHRIRSNGTHFIVDRRTKATKDVAASKADENDIWWCNQTYHPDLEFVAKEVLRDRILKGTAKDMMELKALITKCHESVCEDFRPLMELGQALHRKHGTAAPSPPTPGG